MSFLDTVRAAAVSGLAEFNTFLLEYKPGGHRVFVFVEGRDDPCFYRRLVEQRLPKGYALRLVRCGNRRAVIDAVSNFLGRYPPDASVIALLDKDHSDLVPGSPATTYRFAFQTTWYSVESYVCEPLPVCRHCVESLGIPDGDSLSHSIEQQYQRAQARFYDVMRRCMAWIVA
ncbi:MAG: DUF4435 domain-containing protein, partial [Candidatus Hydrogenedentales bacterium]